MADHAETLLRIAARPMPERIACALGEIVQSEQEWQWKRRARAIACVQLCRDILKQCVTDLDGLILTMKEDR